MAGRRTTTDDTTVPATSNVNLKLEEPAFKSSWIGLIVNAINRLKGRSSQNASRTGSASHQAIPTSNAEAASQSLEEGEQQLHDEQNGCNLDPAVVVLEAQFTALATSLRAYESTAFAVTETSGQGETDAHFNNEAPSPERFRVSSTLSQTLYVEGKKKKRKRARGPSKRLNDRRQVERELETARTELDQLRREHSELRARSEGMAQAIRQTVGSEPPVTKLANASGIPQLMRLTADTTLEDRFYNEVHKYRQTGYDLFDLDNDYLEDLAIRESRKDREDVLTTTDSEFGRQYYYQRAAIGAKLDESSTGIEALRETSASIGKPLPTLADVMDGKCTYARSPEPSQDLQDITGGIPDDMLKQLDEIALALVSSDDNDRVENISADRLLNVTPPPRDGKTEALLAWLGSD